MKNGISAITCTSRKRFGAVLLTACLILTLSSGPVFAANESTDQPLSAMIKSNEEIEQEMAEAFSEVFSNEFSESNFQGMTITYDENGIPIVVDPQVPQKGAVYAAARYEKNGFYSSSDCLDKDFVFWVLKGSEVEAVDSSVETTAVKVKYAGSTGYMKKSELKF